jgi:hypothetical protein
MQGNRQTGGGKSIGFTRQRPDYMLSAMKSKLPKIPAHFLRLKQNSAFCFTAEG